jgi:hypothetical protein
LSLVQRTIAENAKRRTVTQATDTGILL